METQIKAQKAVLEQQLQQRQKSSNPIAGFFSVPISKPPIKDASAVKEAYSHWRMRIFYSIFIGYVVFYLGKKNLSAALPAMTAQLGFTNTELGLLGSSLYFTYAIGKFVNGVLADRANVRTFLPTALALSAIANICFAVSSIFITPGKFTFFGLPSATILLWALAFFWGCNGWFQSAGFPAIAKSLTYWYSNNERGTKWALWSTSHQTGTFLCIIISGFLISTLGWRAAFYVPAILSVGVSAFLFNRLRDKPETLGLPDIEHYREPDRAKACPINEETTDNETYGQIFKKHILFNKTIWMLAIAYVFVYIIRFGTEDWSIKYLVEVKNNTLPMAAMKLSFLPLFGIAGTIAAGYFSDKIFKCQRAPINVIYLAGVILSIAALKLNQSGPDYIDFICMGMIGFFTYGPQMLIGGLCAVESSSKKVASAATGFTGTFGYVGAIISGIGTGLVVDHFGWNGALYFWGISALLCIMICLPMWNNKGSK